MRRYAPILLSSLLSAILAIFGYRLVEKPREVLVRESIPARFTFEDPDTRELSQSGPHVFQSAAPTDFIQAAHLSTPAVVNIKTIQSGGNGGNFHFFRNDAVTASTGSGVIISADGYIVTNSHVVEGSQHIWVTLNDKREFEAEFVGADPSTDLALVKIETPSELPLLQFGNSDSLQIGEWVLAVGNPFNLESTVTAGIVSAKGRSIDILEGRDRIESFIQTDAAVNPGNSGGALVNSRGELIGINTAIITRSGRYEGYSFAVPANLARKVIRDLRDYGLVQRGLLGVYIDEVNNELAAQLKLNSVEGVYIREVTPGGGAADAGLRHGDVIVSINGAQTRTLPEMQELVGRYRPGNVLDIEFIRKGKRDQTSVTLKNKSNNTEVIAGRDNNFLLQLGFELRNLTKTEISKLGFNGVKVTSVVRGSKIDRTNLNPEFIITRVNQEKVSSVEEVVNLIKKANGPVVLEGYYGKKEDPYYYSFDLPAK
ncbi:MAG: Do family serine endopeptidase [Lewinellaceae bacterium]|nr:Do family serine endopeptidase [Lewinellaceae bacterium]